MTSVRGGRSVLPLTQPAWRPASSPIRGPQRVAPLYAYSADTMVTMSAARGRIRRPDNVPTVLLQARVAPSVREQVAAAAKASGVSFAFYLEALLQQEIEAHGQLPVLEVGRPQREELPIAAA